MNDRHDEKEDQHHLTTFDVKKPNELIFMCEQTTALKKWEVYGHWP